MKVSFLEVMKRAGILTSLTIDPMFKSLISKLALFFIVLLIMERIPLNKNAGKIDFLLDISIAIDFKLEKALK